jgi:hypothetical protein
MLFSALAPPSLRTLPHVAAVTGATLRACIPPVARIRAIPTRPRTRRVAIARIRADPRSTRRARRRRAADQPIVAWVQSACGAATPDICAVEPGPTPLRNSESQQHPRDTSQPAQRPAPRLARHKRPRHRIEPLSIHDRATFHPDCPGTRAGIAPYRDSIQDARGLWTMSYTSKTARRQGRAYAHSS